MNTKQKRKRKKTQHAICNTLDFNMASVTKNLDPLKDMLKGWICEGNRKFSPATVRGLTFPLWNLIFGENVDSSVAITTSAGLARTNGFGTSFGASYSFGAFSSKTGKYTRKPLKDLYKNIALTYPPIIGLIKDVWNRDSTAFVNPLALIKSGWWTSVTGSVSVGATIACDSRLSAFCTNNWLPASLEEGKEDKESM